MSIVGSIAIVALLVCQASFAFSNEANSTDLPTVDLGYGIHRATFNDTAQYYNFSFIRYAKAPVGERRFKAPVPLTLEDRNETVDDGQSGAICWQAHPAFEVQVPGFLGAYLKNASLANLPNITYPTDTYQPPVDGRSTEDCLKLNVYTSKRAFDSRIKSNGTKKAPVLVYIHGGGYTEGSIDTDKNPAGFFDRLNDTKLSQDGLVYVAMNYRLGAFGFLAGPTFQKSGTPNAGFYDQRLALEWIQEHIHLFGGDRNKVTVMGLSAGGGSIIHHLTSYGGSAKVPFQQAIPQSPGYFPIKDNSTKEEIYNKFVEAVGATNFEHLQQIPEGLLVQANIKVVENAPYGQFVFGPAVDGDYVPDLPSQLLKQGRFNSEVKVMTSHQLNEGLLSASAGIQTNEDYLNALAKLRIGGSAATFVADSLYPPVFNGSQGYTDQISRYATTVADLGFLCNCYWLQRALNNSNFGYLFSVLPGLHLQDLTYTFYDGQMVDTYNFQQNATVARLLQRYILNFVADGDPNGPDLPQFERYGSGMNVQKIGSYGVESVVDTVVPKRCDYWQDTFEA